MFEKVVFDYDAKDLKVVPITPGTKACKVSDWINVDFTECADKYTGFGIGLSLGCSDLVMLDLDFENEQTKKEVEYFLKDYPTPIMRLGNPNRPPARFYQKSWQKGSISQAVKGGAIEIRSVRPGGMSQVVIPPSIHPESGTQYKWVGTHNLLNFDLDKLPVFPIEAWEKLKKRFGVNAESTMNNDVELVQNEPNRCMNGSNIKYSAMVRAAVLEEKPIEEIVKDLIYFDEKHQKVKSFFLCKHGKSWKHKTIEENAEDFVRDAYARAIKQGDVRGVGLNKTALIDKTKIKMIQHERLKPPKLRGVAQKVFEYIYENSPVPRSRLSFAASLCFISTILANKIKMQDVYPNFYFLLVCASGGGKDYPLYATWELLELCGQKHLIGQSSSTSDTAVIQTLSDQRERCDVIDEVSGFFGTSQNYMKDAHGAKKADVYTELYTRSGKVFRGKDMAKKKAIGKCHSPYVNLITATTPDGFTQTVKESVIKKGLGSRFLFFFDDKVKKSKFLLGSHKKELDDEVIRFAKYWREEFGVSDGSDEIDLNRPSKAKSILIEQDALKLLALHHEAIEELKIRFKNSDRILPIINRVEIQLHKLVIIDAASTQFGEDGFTIPRVKPENVEWAWEFIEFYLKASQEFLDEYLEEDEHNYIAKNIKAVEKIIKQSENGVSKEALCRKTYKKGIVGKMRDALISELVDAGRIIITEEKTSGRPKTVYHHKTNVRIENDQK